MSLHGAPRTHSKIRDWHLIASPQQAMEDADAETVSARDASEADALRSMPVVSPRRLHAGRTV